MQRSAKRSGLARLIQTIAGKCRSGDISQEEGIAADAAPVFLKQNYLIQ
jgi:hypothetical protein